MISRSLALTFVTLLLLAAAGEARAADTPIATLPPESTFDAFGGHVIVSTREPGSKRWRLGELTAAGIEPLKAAPSAKPFDIDLGRDRSGAVVAVYSRCRRVRGNAPFRVSHRCDLFRYDLAAQRETSIAKVNTARFDEYEPTIWGSRIAFVRGLPKGDFETKQRLYVRDLRPGHKTRRLRSPLSAQFPDDLDLRGRSAGIQWGREWSDAVALGNVTRSGRVILSTPGSGAAAQVYSTPNPRFADAHTLYWGLASSDPDYSEVWREDLRTRRLEHSTTRIPAVMRAFAQDGDVSFYAVRTDPGDEGSPLELHRLDGLAFEPAPKLTLDGGPAN